jgi:hypothetical protein
MAAADSRRSELTGRRAQTERRGQAAGGPETAVRRELGLVGVRRGIERNPRVAAVVTGRTLGNWLHRPHLYHGATRQAPGA